MEMFQWARWLNLQKVIRNNLELKEPKVEEQRLA